MMTIYRIAFTFLMMTCHYDVTSAKKVKKRHFHKMSPMRDATSSESKSLVYQYNAVSHLFPNHIVLDAGDVYRFHDLTETGRRQSVCKQGCRLPVTSNATYQTAQALSEAIGADKEEDSKYKYLLIVEKDSFFIELNLWYFIDRT